MRLFRETLSTARTPVLFFHYKAYICILLAYSLKYMVIFYQKKKKNLTKDTTIQTDFIGPKTMGN